MQYAALLRKSLASSRHLPASRLSFSIRGAASMASASSDLYRTTSASTASSSGGPEMYTTASTSAADSPRRMLNKHASRSSLHDGQQSASDTPNTRRQRKKKTANKQTPITSSSASCLPGFVAATSLTSSRQSPSSTAKPVAASLDVKGKGRASDNDSSPVLPQGGGHELTTVVNLANDSSQSPTLHERHAAPMIASQLGNTSVARETASPEDSAASSTDELPYSPSPNVSPQVTPQTKMSARDASVTPKSSPFKAPLTGFHFLAVRNLAVEARSSTVAAIPNTEGLGIAGSGLEKMPALQFGASTPEVNVQEVRSAPLDPAKKKTASSPLTWSTGHKALDAPTLGSPTLGSMRETEDSEEVARNAITKAAFSVSQATILQELAKRKAQSKLLLQQTSEAQYTPDSVRQPEDTPVLKTEKEQENEQGMPEDGVKKKDMALPQRRNLSPPSKASNYNYNLNVQAAASAPDQSPLAVDGTTSATADIEDDIDDGASEASITSHLMHSVVRDADLARGWEALDASDSTKDKARQRLESAIYELNKRHRPSQAVITARQEMLVAIRKRLNFMLKDWAPNFQYNLETFGSTKYGLDTDSSDLDLCIVDPHRPDGFRDVRDLYDLTLSKNGQKEAIASTEEDEENNTSTPFSRHKKNKEWAKPEMRKRMALGDVYDVQRLADALRKMGHQQVIAIPNAIVPIVKFKSREGIKADMLGVRNSTLIAEYISMKRIIRPFLIFLKVWAKQRQLNDPSGQKGLMSLSSYSLVLMAIAYLQHAGIVPNLQDADLIKQTGVAREVFWSKVPNPDAPKTSHWTKRKYLGDYKAMAIDTTFVRAENLDSQVEGSATSNPYSNVAKTKKDGRAKSGSIGWESGNDDVQSASEASNPDGSMELLKLIEGFFEYYLGFPTENKAVSVWRGKPIDRNMPFEASSQSPRKLRRAMETLRAEQREHSDTEGPEGLGSSKRIVEGNGHSSFKTATRLSDSDATHTSEATTITEDEELQALYDKLDGKMRKLGIKEESPSFELTLKSEKQKKRSRTGASAELTEPSLPAMQEIDALEEMAETGAIGPANHAHKGLEPWQASPETNLFDMPPVEDPERFVTPPTWTQLLVVQDPFIHTRNTTMNIIPETVSLIWKEMERALNMVQSGEPLNKICSNVRHEPSYKRKSQFRSHRELERRRAVRTEGKTEGHVRKQRHRKKNGQRAEKPGREADVKAT